MNSNLLSIEEILAMSDGVEKVRELAVYALLNDEAHHKQWYIERLLESLGVNLAELQLEFDGSNERRTWQKGIAP